MPLADAPVAHVAPKPASPVAVLGVAMLIAGLCIVTYYIAAGRYFADKFAEGQSDLFLRGTADGLAHDAVMARLPWFSLFAVTFIGMSTVAMLWPRHVAKGLLPVFAVGNLVVGFASLTGHRMPAPFLILYLVVGVLFAVFGWAYTQRGSRAAWAALASMCGVFAGVMLFGSTKIAAMLGVNVWISLLPCALYVAATVALRSAAPPEAA